MMIKAVLFDLDGTLIDSENYYTSITYKFILKYNPDVKLEDVFGIIGLTMDDTYAYISRLCNKQIKDEYLKYLDDNPFSFKEILFDDVRDCFSQLKNENYKIGICSMSDNEYVKRCVDECELRGFVDYYIGGDKCIHNKPDPEIYLHALSILGLNKENVIVVEDASTGIEAGKNAGLKVIARNADRFGINQSSADIIINGLDELIGIIGHE